MRRAFDTIYVAFRRSRDIPSASRAVYDWKYYVSAALGERASVRPERASFRLGVELAYVSAAETAVLQDRTGRWHSGIDPGISLALRSININSPGSTVRPASHQSEVSLLSIDPECELLDRISAPRDFRWAARLFWLVLLIAQCAAVLVGAVRRVTFSASNDIISASATSGASDIADSPLDQVNTLSAIAGLIIGLNSIAITALNHKWYFDETGNREREPLVADWEQSDADTVRLVLLAFFVDTVLSFRLYRYHYVVLWNSSRERLPIMTLINSITMSPVLVYLVVHAATWACFPILPRKRWNWLAVLPNWQSSSLPPAELCLISVLYGRLVAVLVVAWTIQSISYCHGHHNECGNPFWMWKDPVMDKLYTF